MLHIQCDFYTQFIVLYPLSWHIISLLTESRSLICQLALQSLWLSHNSIFKLRIFFFLFSSIKHSISIWNRVFFLYGTTPNTQCTDIMKACFGLSLSTCCKWFLNNWPVNIDCNSNGNNVFFFFLVAKSIANNHRGKWLIPICKLCSLTTFFTFNFRWFGRRNWKTLHSKAEQGYQ